MKKLLLYCIVFVIASTSVSAQTQANKDSLLHALQIAKADSNKVKLLLQLGKLYVYSDAKTADKYYLQAMELGKKINDNESVFECYAGRSDLLAIQGQNDSALNLCLEMLDWSKKINDSLKIGRSLSLIGIRYMGLHEMENSMKYFELSRTILERRDKSGKFEALANYYLGLINCELHQYNKAIGYTLKAIEKYTQINDLAMLSAVTLTHGYNYIGLKKYDSARHYLEMSLSLAKQTNNIDAQILDNLNIGYIYMLQRDFDRMKPYADTGLTLSDKYGIPDYKGRAFWGLAAYYLSKKQYQQSKIYADSSFAIAIATHDDEQRLRLLLHLSNLSFAMQDTKQGYNYMSGYEGLRDSMINDNLQRITTDYEKKYETQKQETQIQLQQAEIKQKRNLNYLLGGAVLSTLLIGLFGYRSYRQKQKLQQLKINELETEKQLTATEAVLKGEEQERTRLAKDLHDGLGGMLSGIKYSLSNVKENLIMTPDNAQAFERSIDMLDSSIKEMRRVAHNMMPEVLVKYGLDTALKEFCGEIDRSGVIHTNYLSINMEAVEIPHITAVTIYRIVQELVNNIIKHAAAKNILVQAHISLQEKLLAITVEDDGKGFDIAALGQQGGIGWKNIQNRVEFLKAKLDVQSAPGKGTSVMIETIII